MKRRDFLKNSAALASLAFLPSCFPLASRTGQSDKLRVAFIGIGGKGLDNLNQISSHPAVEVAGLCDVDLKNMAKAVKLFPEAASYKDYRVMLAKLGGTIDAVAVSTPDHSHAPASLMAMNMGLNIFCEKPLTHHVSEAREMLRVTEEKKLVSQMGIQCHSSDEYRKAVALIQSGIIGKVSCVRAWSNKNWGFDGPAPTGSDPVPEHLDWNLWLGTAAEREYKNNMYHPGNWRKVLDYGCGTLGDMGVHIFDTPYTALDLDVPRTIRNNCRMPSGFGYPEKNTVEYEFPGTKYTTKNLKWVWYDGINAPGEHEDLKLPGNERLPQQGAMFIGEKGRILLPHWDYPRLLVDGKFEPVDLPDLEIEDHYQQFVDSCLGRSVCSAPFSYGARLSETILLGVVANRFPNETLHWDRNAASFSETAPNALLSGQYRQF